MTTTGLGAFDKAVQQGNIWIKEMSEALERPDRHKAYAAMRAALHVLRDCLTVEEATDLGAQLPTLIRGIYYEGWNPAVTPKKIRRKEDFVEAIRSALGRHDDIDPLMALKALFSVLEQHVSAGELDEVVTNLTRDVRSLIGR
ncbi:MAG TPA: DUF2267 domain-containing protein [Acidobacteriota bacterium]|nr:DUF2267 domain-containing protein [Acidobacteriota bacterium]